MVMTDSDIDILNKTYQSGSRFVAVQCRGKTGYMKPEDILSPSPVADVYFVRRSNGKAKAHMVCCPREEVIIPAKI